MNESLLLNQLKKSFYQQKNHPLVQTSARKRELSFNQFIQMGLPNKKNEDFKYINFRSIENYMAQSQNLSEHTHPHTFDIFPKPHKEFYTVAIYNGSLIEDMFDYSLLKNFVKIESLIPLSDANSHPFAYLNLINYQNQWSAFSILNSAFSTLGLHITIEQNKTLNKPIHLIFYSDHSQTQNLRILYDIKENSSLEIYETYMGKKDQIYFNNIVHEILLSPLASLKHTKIQNESRKSFHISTQLIHQKRSSSFQSNHFALGSELARNELRVNLEEEKSHCHLSGLYYAPTDHQTLDQYIQINHQNHETKSTQNYKGVIGGKSHAIFNGKVHVLKNITKIDASQMNKNLLLSDQACIDTRPQLEILSDDVRCSHGATVGQLDKEVLFYLKSRGIPQALCEQMIQFAFVSEILEQVNHLPIKNYLSKHILNDEPVSSLQNLSKPN